MANKTTELTNNEYRAIKAYSKSDLDNAHKSVALLNWSKNVKRDKSDTADIGNATHAALLEPDSFIYDYVKIPEFGTSHEEKRKSEAFNATMMDANKTTLTAKDYKMVIDMCDSALAHPVANKLLTSKGESEVSIFFEIDGIKCKCRPDRIVDPSVFDQHILVDVKTCADVSKFDFSARDYRYDVQDAWYSEGYFKLTGHYPRFFFVVIGKQKVFGSHPVRVFELSQEDKENGQAQYIKDLDSIKELEEFGIGQLEVETISLPKRWK